MLKFHGDPVYSLGLKWIISSAFEKSLEPSVTWKTSFPVGFDWAETRSGRLKSDTNKKQLNRNRAEFLI